MTAWLLRNYIGEALTSMANEHFRSLYRRIEQSANRLCSSISTIKQLFKRLKICIADSQRKPALQLRDVTCHVGSHSVTCHPIRVKKLVFIIVFNLVYVILYCS